MTAVDNPGRHDAAATTPAWNEPERLAALQRYAILDTPPEAAYDEVTRMLTDVFDAPMSAVTLVDEARQWFKAQIGLGAPETPIGTSICKLALLQGGSLVVPDTLADTQFSCNPLVTGAPGIRFYAGEALVTPDGYPLGMLCVLDHKPRPQGISAAQQRMLKTLAGLVMGQLELRRVVAEQNSHIAERLREQSRVEEQLRQSQKMEAIGQLTGGIAHDFNNLLQGISMSLEMLRHCAQTQRYGDLERYIGSAMGSAQRAGALTHRLLAFARRQPLDPKVVEVNPLVVTLEDMLRRTLGAHVTLELALGESVWPLLCDLNQLENALLNLSINARDAMPDGGRLRIATSNVVHGTGPAGGDGGADGVGAAPAGLAPGEYVAIVVTDNGSGMSPSTLARAFEPFYTTKPIGQGTGLGLSMIYGFAQQSDGHASIASTLGVGTTVTLYLPRHHSAAAATDASADAAGTPVASGNETVLVVEDEPLVRNLIVDALSALGYRVIEAVDGPSGLAILQSARPVDLLVSDIGLPGVNGRQMADAARLTRPALKVLFMTGYAESASFADGFLDNGMQLITKPFPLDQLATRVRQIIEPG